MTRQQDPFPVHEPMPRSRNSTESLGSTDSGDGDEPTCRICLLGSSDPEAAEAGRLFTPCRCAGSMQFVHERCLYRWMATSNNSADKRRCAQCRTRYKIRYRRKKRVIFYLALRWGLGVALAMLWNVCYASMLPFWGRCVQQSTWLPWRRDVLWFFSEDLLQRIEDQDWERVPLTTATHAAGLHPPWPDAPPHGATHSRSFSSSTGSTGSTSLPRDGPGIGWSGARPTRLGAASRNTTTTTGSTGAGSGGGSATTSGTTSGATSSAGVGEEPSPAADRPGTPHPPTPPHPAPRELRSPPHPRVPKGHLHHQPSVPSRGQRQGVGGFCRRKGAWDLTAAAVYGTVKLSGQSLFFFITMRVLTHQDWVLHLPGTVLHEVFGVHEDSVVLWLTDAAMPFVWLGWQFWCCSRYAYFHFMPTRHRDLVVWVLILVLGAAVELSFAREIVDAILFRLPGVTEREWQLGHLQVLDLDEWKRNKQSIIRQGTVRRRKRAKVRPRAHEP